MWAWLGGVCLAWACAWASPAQASEGLQPKAEDFAPFVLSVPGEAMLLDPAGLSPDEDEDEDAPPLPSNPYELRETERGGASWYGARFHRRRTASGELFDMRALTARRTLIAALGSTLLLGATLGMIAGLGTTALYPGSWSAWCNTPGTARAQG